jgi:hypothetical protein
MLNVNNLIGFGVTTQKKVDVVLGSYFGLTSTRSSYTFNSVAFSEPSADRYIIVSVHGRQTTTPTLNSVTIGGVSATLLVQQRNTSSGLSISSFWIAYVPTGTSGSVVVTFSGNMGRCMGHSYAIYNLNSTTPISTATAGTANTNPLILNANVQPNTVYLATVHNNNSTTSSTAWSGADEQYDVRAEGQTSGAIYYASINETPRAVSATFSGTVDRTSGVAVVLK